MSIRQRFRDWLHEHEIKRLSAACRESYEAGDKPKARHFWQAQAAAIKARSPEQVARMEARMGLRLRRTLKQRVMDAFLRGRIPSRVVTTTFRLFKLRSL